jgi:inhibitor of cysteine peptidase
MPQRFRVRPIALYLVAGLLAVAILAAAKDNPGSVTANETNNGQTIALQRGQVLVVSLNAQLGTGFGWHVVKYDRDNLKLRGGPQIEAPDRPGVGAPQPEIFRFEAKGDGSSVVQLDYKRAWEKNTPPAKTFRLTVVVK